MSSFSSCCLTLVPPSFSRSRFCSGVAGIPPSRLPTVLALDFILGLLVLWFSWLVLPVLLEERTLKKI